MEHGNYPESIPAVIDVEDSKHVATVVLPSEGGEWDVKTLDFEQYQPHPRRKVGSLAVRTVDSLIKYVNRHKDIGTVGFADPNGGIKVVLNHHGDAAGWRDHDVTLTREKTTAYVAWKSSDGYEFGQAAFAEFLENRIGEIVEPSGASLFELATFFTAKTSIGFSSSKNLSNGQVQLTYVENIEGGTGQSGNVTVPNEFTVLLRPYKDAPAPVAGQPDKSQFVVKARLRWRLRDQKVFFSYHLGEELEQHLDGIHNDDIERVEAECVIDVLRGDTGR